jgi:hypothetical protein
MIFKCALKSDSEHITGMTWITIAAALRTMMPARRRESREKQTGSTGGSHNVIKPKYHLAVRLLIG